MTKFAYIATDAGIETAIGKAKTQGATLQASFHRIAVSILMRMEKDSDHNTCVRLVNSMIEALPAMTRKNAMKTWVEKYMGYAYNKDDKAFVFAKVSGFKINVKAAVNEPFWDCDPEKDYQPISDWTKLVAGLVARGLKDLEKMGENSKVDMEQLAILQKLVPVKSAQTKAH